MRVLFKYWKNKLVDLTAFCLREKKQRDYLRIVYAGAAVECIVSRKQTYLLLSSGFLPSRTHFYMAVRVTMT